MEPVDCNNLEKRLSMEFEVMNHQLFDDFLDLHTVKMSRRAVRTHGSINLVRKTIRISLQLYEQYGWESVRMTLLHEMTHAYIHKLGGRASHSKRFWNEFEKRGGIRDRLDVKPKKCYVYACPTCGSEIHRLRKIKIPSKYSCIKCDRKYNPSHKLYLKRDKHQESIINPDQELM